MKKKVVFLITALLCALGCMFGVAACSDSVESYYNLTCSGQVYFDGEQTVSLEISEHTSNVTTFKENVTANDITVSGVLSGKTVKSVTFKNSQTLEVTFTGKVTADSSHSEETGTITVSHKAMENGANACTYVKVDFAPKMFRSYNHSDTVKKKYISEFTLPYGNFISENVNTDKITVMPSDITVSVSITDDGALRIETVGFEPYEYNGTTYNNPVAKLDACVTSFNKELYVKIGDSALLAEYSLI